MNNSFIKKQFFPISQFMETSYKYENIDKNIELRKSITDFFFKKANKWADLYKFKKTFSNIDIYKILKHFFRKNNLNWFDYEKKYYNLKKYIIKKLFFIQQ